MLPGAEIATNPNSPASSNRYIFVTVMDPCGQHTFSTKHFPAAPKIVPGLLEILRKMNPRNDLAHTGGVLYCLEANHREALPSLR